MDPIDQVIGKNAGITVRQETLQLLREHGPNLKKTLLRLDQALDSKETRLIKIKGKITKKGKEALPKGCNLVTAQKEESLLAIDLIAHNTRLRAADLALQLHDAMPSQKHELSADTELINAFIDGLPRSIAGSVCAKLTEHISGRSNKKRSGK